MKEIRQKIYRQWDDWVYWVAQRGWSRLLASAGCGLAVWALPPGLIWMAIYHPSWLLSMLLGSSLVVFIYVCHLILFDRPR